MQPESNLFSIIIATYNRKSTLPRALQSILIQTYQNLEVIVVDDGSTDGTSELFKAQFTDSRITSVLLPHNQGATTTRNYGIQEAKGDIVMVWDSDDELFPDALETLNRIFADHTDVSVVSAPAKQMKLEKEIPYTYVPSGMMALEDVLCKKLPNNEKIRAVKRECFNDVRYESRNLDFMVNGYLAQKGKWYHYDRPLGLLNIERGDSLTKARRKANQQLSIERAHHLEEYLLTFGEQMKQSCVTRYAALCYGAALGLLLEGEKDKALKWATEMCASDKRYISYWLLHKLTYLPFGTFVMRFGFKLKKILKL